IADMQRKRFEIRSVTEPDLCSDDPTRTLLRQMMGAFAEYERKMIVLKLRGARQRKRQQSGSCEGRKPYGSRPGEREVIERMFHHYDLGSGYGGIANALNNEGLRQRNGNLWSVNTVRRILLREPLRLHRMTLIESLNSDGPVAPLTQLHEKANPELHCKPLRG